MRIVVLTGMSGSGKTNALRALEDISFYAIDNLPIPLLDKLVELFSGSQGEVEKLALVVDARAAAYPQSAAQTGELTLVPPALEVTREAGHEVELVFLDAEDSILERRFSETRRRHPLSADGSVPAGIEAERLLVEPLRKAASLVINTSQMSVHDLRRQLQKTFTQPGTKSGPRLSVMVTSFGFKHGSPTGADLVFDVRFLPNPYFVESLRDKTGLDSQVSNYVLERDASQAFLSKLQSLLSFLLPQYAQEGKAYLTIAIGCTGGKHRSVAITEHMAAWIKEQGFLVQSQHRDSGRWGKSAPK